MKTRVANCPSCGGPVEFRERASLVTVCEFCQTVVARGDKSVEDHGKVADLALTNSPLQRGVTGKFRNKSFELVGRVQYKHPAGGVWDEWYLSFGGGRKWGWLAEAQGKFYLTFENKASSKLDLPSIDDLEPGRRFKLGSIGEITVAEVGVAETGAAEGEIPWDYRPGAPHPFADLHGDDRKFVTFDYSGERPRLFIGAEIDLDDLNLSPVFAEMGPPGIAGGGPKEKVSALSVNCPECGGPLKLRRPDETERVTCPNCSSLLDCTQGKLEFFQTLRTRAVKPVIPLGQTGTLFGEEYTVIGFMERFARYQGMSYPWTEYLLHHPRVGYRWLVRNEKHWSFVEPLSPHEVTLSYGSALYDGEYFDVYDRGDATVRYVLGEFYWKVMVGERVHTADYISPPRMISSERTDDQLSQELNISLGTYLTVDEVEDAFGVEHIARPFGVGVIQPKPNFMGEVARLWGLFAVVLIGIFFACKSLMTTAVDGEFFFWMLVAVSAVPVGSMFYLHNFEVQRWADSDYSPYATEEE